MGCDPFEFYEENFESKIAFMTVSPFETYQHYLSLKNHFTNPKYDFFKYGAKTRASITSFNKRKDKYFFEKTHLLTLLVQCNLGLYHTFMNKKRANRPRDKFLPDRVFSHCRNASNAVEYMFV